jgi:hypothetical protein
MENGRERTRNRRNPNRRYASDYYYNSDQPRWTERDEAWYRHTYGLPASGRMGQRRHDVAEWGNPSFTQNTTNRERQRFNDYRDDREIQRRDDLQYENEYEYKRSLFDDRRGTWNRRGDESYNWGEYSRYEQPGLHRGKGPKGFARSDERLREDINCRLTDDAYVDASAIDVNVENGDVTLTGTVSDRFEKRRAEDIAELVSGVKNVENRIRVK